MELRRHDIWSIYQDDAKTLSMFYEKHVPKMQLRNDVSEDVCKSFSIISKMLIHSFYEYEFIDVAFTKLLHTFEMALKIRYEELNNKAWPKSKRLEQLINWFREGGYFEINGKDFLDHVRNVRNRNSHPENYSLGGVGLFHWFDTIVDMINDLYADVDARKKRLEKVDRLNKGIQKILKNGSEIRLKDESIIYDARILFLEESGEKSNYLFCFKRIFELDDKGYLIKGQKSPLQLIELENFEFELSDDCCKFGAFSIVKLTELDKQNRFENWISVFKTNSNYSMFNWQLDLEINKEWKKKRRQAIHQKHFL